MPPTSISNAAITPSVVRLDLRSTELSSSWREEYFFGQAAVDAAHKNLLADMNALARAVNVGARDMTPPLLAQIQFTATHDFMIEEELMLEDSYPFLDLHARQHQRFFEYFGDLKREIEHGEEDRVYLAFRVRRLLTDWLVNHILNANRHFAAANEQSSGCVACRPARAREGVMLFAASHHHPDLMPTRRCGASP